jgi:hypothetical protein
VGRGEGKSKQRVARGQRPRVGQIWRDPDGRQVTIVDAARGFEHVGLIARDRLGLFLLDPKLLGSRYELVRQGDGPLLRRRKPLPDPIVAEEIAAERAAAAETRAREAANPEEGASKRQLGYLRKLAEQAGEQLPENLSKRQASRRIDELKARLAA